MKKGFTKSLQRVTHKLDAAAIGIGQSVSHLGRVLTLDRRSDADVGFDVAGIPGPSSAGAFQGGQGELVEHAGPPWDDLAAAGCDYLCICVHEARNLVMVDYDSRSTSAFVKISIGGDAEGGKAPLESQTRACHRNRNPMWGQSFFFPLAGLTPSTRLCAAVYSHTKMALVDQFSGQVLTSLEHLLRPLQEAMTPFSRWYDLGRKRMTDRVSGEIFLTVSMLPKYIYDVVQWSEDGVNLLDPQMLQTLLHSYSLKISLHEISSIRLQQDLELPLSQLSLQVRVGHCILSMNISPKNVQTSLVDGVQTTSFSIDEEVTLPLTRSFDISHSWATKQKNKDEVGDIRLYLMHGSKVLSKSQVPVWDVPLCKDQEVPPAAAAQAAGRPEVPSSDLEKQSQSVDLDAEPEPERGSGVGLQTNVSIMCGKRSAWSAFDRLLRGLAGAEQAPRSCRVVVTSLPAAAVPGDKLEPASSSQPGDFLDTQPLSSPSRDSPPQALLNPKPLSALSSYLLNGSPGSQGAGLEPQNQSTGELPLVTGLAILRSFIRRSSGSSGIRYRRVMETYSEMLQGSPELSCSMRLVPTKLEDSKPVGFQIQRNISLMAADEDDAVTEDGLDQAGQAPEPIELPAALSIVVAEVVVGARPSRAFETMFKAESPFHVRMVEKEGLREVSIGRWQADDSSRGARSRVMTYIRPISIPMPFSPKQCNVTEVQSLLLQEVGGFVLEKMIKTDAPKGDTFFVQIQIVGVADGPAGTRVRVSFKVEFVKGVGLLKGPIESGAVSSTKKLLQDWVNELAKELGTPSLALATAASRQSAVPGPSTATAASPAPPGLLALEGFGVLQLRHMLLLLLLLVFLQLLALLFVGTGVWSVAKSMKSMQCSDLT